MKGHSWASFCAQAEPVRPAAAHTFTAPMMPDSPFHFLLEDGFWRERMPLYIKSEVRGHSQHPIEAQHTSSILLDPWIITRGDDEKLPKHVSVVTKTTSAILLSVFGTFVVCVSMALDSRFLEHKQRPKSVETGPFARSPSPRPKRRDKYFLSNDAANTYSQNQRTNQQPSSFPPSQATP